MPGFPDWNAPIVSLTSMRVISFQFNVVIPIGGFQTWGPFDMDLAAYDITVSAQNTAGGDVL